MKYSCIILYYFHLQRVSGVNDPAPQAGDIGIDAGVAGPGTSAAPGNHAHKLVVRDQRTTGVTLAGVLLLAGGTDHGLQNRVAAVVVRVGGTVLVVQQINLHLLKGVGGGAEKEAGGAPAGDHGIGSGNGLGVGQFDGPDLRGLANGRAQLDDGHIVDHQLAVVALVVLEGADGDHLTTGAPGSGTHSHLQLAGGVGLHAMGGGQDGLRIDQTSATEVGALGRLDGHLVGVVFDIRVLAVHNPTEGEVQSRISMAGSSQGDKRHHTQ